MGTWSFLFPSKQNHALPPRKSHQDQANAFVLIALNGCVCAQGKKYLDLFRCWSTELNLHDWEKDVWVFDGMSTVTETG